MNAPTSSGPPPLTATAAQVPRPMQFRGRQKSKNAGKAALGISSLAHGPTLLDLPLELIHEINARAGNPLLVEACKSLATCLLPSCDVHAVIRARYLLRQARAVPPETPATLTASVIVKSAPLPINLGKQAQRARMRKSKDILPTCPHQSLATAALNLGLKTRLLDAQVVHCLDRFASPPGSAQLAQVQVTNRGKWRSVPRWLAQRMLSADPAQVNAALDLTSQLLARGMTIDTGYTVLKMVQQGKLDVLPKLKALGFPLHAKDGLVIEVAVKEWQMEALLFLLQEGIRPGVGAFEVAIKRVCHCVRPQQDEDSVLGHLAKKDQRKRSAVQESSFGPSKRARKSTTSPAAPAPPSTPAQSTLVPGSIALDAFCTLLLSHSAPVSDKSIAIAVMAYPALSKGSIRQLLAAMRRGHGKPSTLAFEAATQNVHAEADLIPLLIEYGGVPEFEHVQGVMARLFAT